MAFNRELLSRVAGGQSGSSAIWIYQNSEDAMTDILNPSSGNYFDDAFTEIRQRDLVMLWDESGMTICNVSSVAFKDVVIEAAMTRYPNTAITIDNDVLEEQIVGVQLNVEIFRVTPPANKAVRFEIEAICSRVDDLDDSHVSRKAIVFSGGAIQGAQETIYELGSSDVEVDIEEDSGDIVIECDVEQLHTWKIRVEYKMEAYS